MKKNFLTVIAFCFAVSQSYAITVVDPKDWVKQHEGDYRIQKAGGAAPKEENSIANVFADTEEGVLTMPFCRAGEPCHVGYLFLPYNETQISEEVLTSGETRSTIQVKDAARTLTYTWTQKGEKALFHNPHFVLDSKAVTMEHDLVKVP